MCCRAAVCMTPSSLAHPAYEMRRLFTVDQKQKGSDAWLTSTHSLPFSHHQLTEGDGPSMSVYPVLSVTVAIYDISRLARSLSAVLCSICGRWLCSCGHFICE